MRCVGGRGAYQWLVLVQRLQWGENHLSGGICAAFDGAHDDGGGLLAARHCRVWVCGAAVDAVGCGCGCGCERGSVKCAQDLIPR